MVAYAAPEALATPSSGWRAPLLAQTSSVDRKASSSPPSSSRWMPGPEGPAESPSATRACRSTVSLGDARLLILTIRLCRLWHTILGSAHWSVQSSGTTSCGQSVLARQAPRSIDASEASQDADMRPLLARLWDEPTLWSPRGFHEQYGSSLGVGASAFLARGCCSPGEVVGPTSRGQPSVQHVTACARERASTTSAAPTTPCHSSQRLWRERPPSSALPAVLAWGCSPSQTRSLSGLPERLSHSGYSSAPPLVHGQATAGGTVTLACVSLENVAACEPDDLTSPPACLNRESSNSLSVFIVNLHWPKLR
mmetsp:Transcript_97361/g.257026  ORF Transcript_97361/g.257026 Transcript_97361/m.257026 type:complete len:310 (-) Transcript_97361:16-945(-)